MQLITNEKWLAAVTGGDEDLEFDAPVPTMNSVCYTSDDATCNPATGSTNMSHASAGTDSSYYGASSVTLTVANASDCKTDTATGTALGGLVGSLGGPAAGSAGALAGLYVSLTNSSGCQPKVIAKP